jgi:hypothetical protein
MDNLDWQLWGTFSVADHLRSRAFVADVLVYNRLLVPVPDDNDFEGWEKQRWRPGLQRTILDVLKQGGVRVEEIKWDAGRREAYQALIKGSKSDMAAGAASDVAAIQHSSPDTPAQWITRMVLVDHGNAERDKAIVRGVPPSPVDIVAAYGSTEEFLTGTGATPTADLPASPDDLLGGFVWPFAVPEESGQSDLDLLKRAVEFTSKPQVEAYRQAFHRWRGKVVRYEQSPVDAASELQHEIDAYANWVRNSGHETVVRTACMVLAIGMGVAAALMPVVGLPIVATAALGAGAAGTPLFGSATSRFFRGQLKSYNASKSPGALFWEAQRFLAS